MPGSWTSSPALSASVMVVVKASRCFLASPFGESGPCLGLVLPEPGLAGAERGLLAVGYLQLMEDIGDVVGNCLGAQGQEPDDFGVGGTLRHEVQHFTLAVGESREGGSSSGASTVARKPSSPTP